jgi:hypothetical protein
MWTAGSFVVAGLYNYKKAIELWYYDKDWIYGIPCCSAWAGLSGYEKYIYPIPYDGLIVYSDPPVFEEKKEEVCSNGYVFDLDSFSGFDTDAWKISLSEGKEPSISIQKVVEGDPSGNPLCHNYKPIIKLDFSANIDNTKLGFDDIFIISGYSESKVSEYGKPWYMEILKEILESGKKPPMKEIKIGDFIGHYYDNQPVFSRGYGSPDIGYKHSGWTYDSNGCLGLEKNKFSDAKLYIKFSVSGSGCWDNSQNTFLESEGKQMLSDIDRIISSIRVKCRGPSPGN